MPGLARSERGLALPVVMGALLLMLIFLATAAGRATIGLNVSAEDVAAKRAVQSARAGIRVALYRMNAVGLDLDQLLRPTDQCLVRTSDGLLALAGLDVDGWCPAVTEDLGTGASYSYRVSAVVTTPALPALLEVGTTDHLLQRRIVATGTADGVTRRLMADVTADGQRTVVSVLLVNLIDSGSLSTYRLAGGSFRECRSESMPSPPDAGC